MIAKRFNTTTQAILSANPMLNEHNLRIGQVIYIPQGCMCNISPSQELQQGISKKELVLSNKMRLLWEQHVYWTRFFIISTAFGLPDLEPVTNRLLQNPKDFEAVLRSFYGEMKAAKFAELFTAHLTIAAELVNAAKAGNTAAAADAEKRWYSNADDIATFLSSINPFWSYQEWQKMLYEHLAMTKNEAVYILTGRYEDSITEFDKIEQQALMMADMMTHGISRQFMLN